MKMLLLLMILAPFTVAGEPTLIYLMRHAEKVDESRDADLSKRGQQRAESLAELFAKIKVDQLICTQFQRTRKTLIPLAAQQKLEPMVIRAEDPEQLVVLAQASAGKTIVIAGHSNTLPDLVQRLGGPEITIAHDSYRDLFLLVLHEKGARLQIFQREP